jgi:hypothetical protein
MASWAWISAIRLQASTILLLFPNPFHIYENAGTYTVTLTVINSYGCSNTISQTVTIAAPPLLIPLQSACLCRSAITFQADPSVVVPASVTAYIGTLVTVQHIPALLRQHIAMLQPVITRWS